MSDVDSAPVKLSGLSGFWPFISSTQYHSPVGWGFVTCVCCRDANKGVVEPHRAVNDLNTGQFKHIDLSESEPYTGRTQSNSLGVDFRCLRTRNRNLESSRDPLKVS